MTVSKALSVLGFIVGIVGLFMIYRFSPQNFDVIDGNTVAGDEGRAAKRNRLAAVGQLLAGVGAFVQLLSSVW